MARKKEAGAASADLFPAGWVALLVGVLVFVLYLPSLSSGFVYDAESQIVHGEYIHQRANFADVLTLRVMSRDVLDFNRPMQLLSLMMDSLFWGRNPLGYHLTSNLLHALTSAGVFLLIVRLLGPTDRTLLSAFLGTLLFAAHPLMVEAVAEVASREDLLAAFFVVLAMLCAEAYGRSRGGWRWALGVACIAAVFLGCASKETGVAACVLITLYWWVYRRQDFRRWAGLIAAAYVVTGIFLGLRFALETTNSQVFLFKPVYIGGSLGMVFQIQPRIWAFLLTLIFWPVHLSADYTPQNIWWITLWAALPVLAAFVALQGWLAWKNRVAAFGGAIFWLGLAPVSNFIPIFRPMADRFMYLPMIGLALTAAGIFVLLRPAVFRVVICGTAILILLLAGLTWKRQAVFANSLNLWKNTLLESPNSDTAANNLGYAHLERKEFELAVRCFEVALQLTKGKKADAWAGMALALERQGRTEEAEVALNRAIQEDVHYADPPALVKAMISSKEQAATLEQILQRQKAP